MGSAVTVLAFRCLWSSFNIQFDHDPFDVFICWSTVNCTKNRDIDFLRLFSLGFQRSCIKTEYEKMLETLTSSYPGCLLKVKT